MIRYGLMILAVGFLLGADEPKKEPVKGDLKKVQGTWVAVEWTENGEKRPEEDVKKVKLIVKDDKWTLMNGDDELKGTMKFDTKKNPKAFDAMTESGDTVYGIYEFHGERFKQCWSPPNQDRPTSFTSKADSGHTCVVWKRAKS